MNNNLKYNHFLILGIKTNYIINQEDRKNILKFNDYFTNDKDIVYSIILTNEAETAKSQGMFLINSKKPISIIDGLNLSHAIETLLPITYFCIRKFIDKINILPISNHVYKMIKESLKYLNLIKLCENEIKSFFGNNIPVFNSLFHSFTIETWDWFNYIMPYLKRYTTDLNFQRGCSYLYLSIDELGVDACDWANSNFDQDFYRFVSISKAEASFINAFKTIESILGEPSKNKTEYKLCEKLGDIKINPYEEVGFIKKEKIIDKILKYHKIRDQIAAHGIGKLKRILTLSEIMDLQKTAQYILLSN